MVIDLPLVEPVEVAIVVEVALKRDEMGEDSAPPAVV
jgi:hypothetical protein